MIECRSRNGWFRLHEASASLYQDGRVAVRVLSKKGYQDMPPIYLEGLKEEILSLLDQLRKELA
jgi:hypothetical protein